MPSKQCEQHGEQSGQSTLARTTKHFFQRSIKHTVAFGGPIGPLTRNRPLNGWKMASIEVVAFQIGLGVPSTTMYLTFARNLLIQS